MGRKQRSFLPGGWVLGAVLFAGSIGALLASCSLGRSGEGPEATNPGAAAPVGGHGAGASGGTGLGAWGGGGQGTGGVIQCAAPGDCPGVDGDCARRACDFGVCSYAYEAVGTPCDEGAGTECDGEGHCAKGLGAPCTAGQDCLSGNCVDGVCCSSPSCGNDDDCDVCNAPGAEGDCGPAAAGTSCDDSLYCNGEDTCDAAGSCTGHGVDPCGSSSVVGCSGGCNEDNDDCSASKLDGTACSDGIYCNGTETCQGGQCTGSTGDPCLSGSCLTNCRAACNEDSDDCSALAPSGTTCNNMIPDSACNDYCTSNGECVH